MIQLIDLSINQEARYQWQPIYRMNSWEEDPLGTTSSPKATTNHPANQVFFQIEIWFPIINIFKRIMQEDHEPVTLRRVIGQQEWMMQTSNLITTEQIATMQECHE